VRALNAFETAAGFAKKSLILEAENDMTARSVWQIFEFTEHRHPVASLKRLFLKMTSLRVAVGDGRTHTHQS
jgi:hypothetical protein